MSTKILAVLDIKQNNSIYLLSSVDNGFKIQAYDCLLAALVAAEKVMDKIHAFVDGNKRIAFVKYVTFLCLTDGILGRRQLRTRAHKRSRIL